LDQILINFLAVSYDQSKLEENIEMSHEGRRIRTAKARQAFAIPHAWRQRPR